MNLTVTGFTPILVSLQYALHSVQAIWQTTAYSTGKVPKSYVSGIRSYRCHLLVIILSSFCMFVVDTSPVYAQSQTNLSNDFIFIGTASDGTQRLAWGDIDGDGDLDLAVANGGDGLQGAPNQIYENENGTFSTAPIWESADARDSRSLAWGDWDGDGDLDLAVGNFDGPNQVFENQNGSIDSTPAWTSSDTMVTHAVSWGDMDGDGDLDLAVANPGPQGPNEDGNIVNCVETQPDQVFENLGGMLGELPLWQSDSTTCTLSVAWGDVNGDGYLDLATGLIGQSRVYTNTNGLLGTTPAWEAITSTRTVEVAWGDMDDDGDLDLAMANWGQDWVYQNEAGQLGATPIWESAYIEDTNHVAWGDYDSDGDLDLATAIWAGQAGIFENSGTMLNRTQDWWLDEVLPSNQVTFSDFDNDGDLDVAFAISGNREAENRIYINRASPLEKNARWSSAAPNNTNAIAWGDVDGDGDLDMAAANNGQPVMVYANISGTVEMTPTWQSDLVMTSVSVAWGDVDSDGDLDLAVGGYEANQLYLNDGGLLQTIPSWESADAKQTRALAWGDVDGDADLDLVVANTGDVNQLFINENGQLRAEPVWQSESIYNSYGAAWGDWDNDGDLDLAFGNWGAENQVYENVDGQLEYAPEQGTGWHSIDQKSSTSVAWGDVDGDGNVELAVGNFNNVNQIFDNVDGMLSPEPIWESTGDAGRTLDVAWGDWNGDGDLDLAVANEQDPIQVYENRERQLSSTAVWCSQTLSRTVSLAWVDWDSDGDEDLSAGNFAGVNLLFENHSNGQQGLVNNPPSIRLTVPSPAVAGSGYASAAVIDAPVIDIPFSLVDVESNPVAQIQAWYSTNGGGRWRPAVATPETVLTNLAASPAGTDHIFAWDTLASGFFGKSDNVRFRIELLDQTTATDIGQFRYANQTPSMAQRPEQSATTYPFRVQGTAVQVESDLAGAIAPSQDAIVFRLPQDSTLPTTLLSDSAGMPYETDHRGRLQGAGEVQIGDQLVAMQPVSLTEYMPITFSNSIDLYFTSASPTAEGVDAHTVAEPGQQRLTVSKENPLLLFNLDVSLEWDARNNPEFLAELERDLLRTSEIIYDLTDGQAALGNVWVYHDKGRWLDAHIVVHATNSLRPNASLGGIVNYAIDDTILAPTEIFTTTPLTIPNAYLPGQIRIGSRWNRFGNKEGSQGKTGRACWPTNLAIIFSSSLITIWGYRRAAG